MSLWAEIEVVPRTLSNTGHTERRRLETSCRCQLIVGIVAGTSLTLHRVSTVSVVWVEDTLAGITGSNCLEVEEHQALGTIFKVGSTGM
jgi:hypothetical protein